MNDTTRKKLLGKIEALEAENAASKTREQQLTEKLYEATSVEEEFATTDPRLEDIFTQILLQFAS